MYKPATTGCQPIAGCRIAYSGNLSHLSACFYQCCYFSILPGTCRRLTYKLTIKVIKYYYIDSNNEETVALTAATAAAVAYYDEKLSRAL